MILLTLVASSNSRLQAQQSEEDLAKVPIENYFKGHATGDSQYARLAFHPDAHMTFVREGKYNNMPIEDYFKRFSGKPSPMEDQIKRRIEKLEINGTSGFAVLVLDSPAAYVTDYMSLLKVDGQWKIIHKSFYAVPRTK